jgi:hypothetical protein
MNNTWVVAFFLLIIVIQHICLAQQDEQGSLRKGKRRRRQQPKVNTAGALSDPNTMIRALTINYPLRFFESGSGDWRTQAKYSASLVQSSEKDRSWGEISQAQDQEDVWLYENWFYGMEKGIIMESGALNGILFSNSFMFEQFANWTAIHVGEPLSL